MRASLRLAELGHVFHNQEEVLAFFLEPRPEFVVSVSE